jgi:hypothetical protein
MAGKDDHPSPGRYGLIHMLDAVGFDPPLRCEHANFAQMRIFGGDSAEIVPHAEEHLLDFGLGKLEQGGPQIDPRPLRYTEQRVNSSGYRASRRLSPIDRQEAEHAKDQHRGRCFEPTRESRKQAGRLVGIEPILCARDCPVNPARLASAWVRRRSNRRVWRARYPIGGDTII